jgi:hypothetical protein
MIALAEAGSMTWTFLAIALSPLAAAFLLGFWLELREVGQESDE